MSHLSDTYRSTVLFVIFCSFFYLTACSDSRPSFDFVEMVGEGKVLDNNPDEYELKDIYGDLTLSQLMGRTSAKEQYILGLVLLGDVQGFSLKQDVYAARRALEESWRLGVVDAGYRLFLLYTGHSDFVDEDVAIKYLLESAEKGYILSQRTLGFAYGGRDVNVDIGIDYSLSRKWFELAALQGDSLSAVNLAGMYRVGEGGDANELLAFSWVFNAENMPYGNPFYSFNGLAVYYENGIGTDINLIQAYKYYDLLSPAGDDDKARLEAQMTPEQIREAIRLSRQWQEEHNIFAPSYYGLEYQEDGSFQ